MLYNFSVCILIYDYIWLYIRNLFLLFQSFLFIKWKLFVKRKTYMNIYIYISCIINNTIKIKYSLKRYMIICMIIHNVQQYFKTTTWISRQGSRQSKNNLYKNCWVCRGTSEKNYAICNMHYIIFFKSNCVFFTWIDSFHYFVYTSIKVQLPKTK